MILKELVDLARREGLVDDPDFEPKPVRWVVVIGAGGKFLDVIETMGTPDPKGKVRPKVYQVPRAPARTSGSSANFLVDKAEYAIGFDPDGNPKKLDKLKHHRELFTEYVDRALAIAPDDHGLAALIQFLRDDESVGKAIAKISGEAAANDLFAFRYSAGGEYTLIHDRDAVRAAWKQMRSGQTSGDCSCLCCGNSAPSARLHPQIGFIPGAAKPVPLISFNKAAFESFGFEGNENAPVCQDCADAYGTALNRLFHPEYTVPDGRTLPRRSLRLSDDTGIIYWASGADEHKFLNEFGELDFADASRAGDLFDSVHEGKGGLLKNTAPFFALIVTGGQGRATLRGYFQSTIGEVATNLRKYFEDIEIVAFFPDAQRWPPLKKMILALAVRGDKKNIDPTLAGRLFLAILSGSIFPIAILQAALGRLRSEQNKHTQERMALIRATLNRRFRVRKLKEIPCMLDENNHNVSYCLGRLFSVLEQAQRAAIGHNINRTIVDGYYGAASSRPRSVFGQLIQKSQNHMGKLRTSDEKGKRLGRIFDKRLREIYALLNPEDAFPATLDLEGQALFALGYYHQKAWRPKKESGKDDPASPIQTEA